MSDTQIIETGDSVKVKQTLDYAAMEAVSTTIHMHFILFIALCITLSLIWLVLVFL